MKKAVAVIISNENEEILLTKRGSQARDQVGTWENPGGAVENKETFEEAAHREIMEELGAKIQIEKELYTEIFKTETIGTWEVRVFLATLLAPAEIQDKKLTAEMKWFKKEELKNIPLASYTKEDFEKLGWL